MNRTFYMRAGKKMRKNWSQSYVRYIQQSFSSGSSGALLISKNKDDDKVRILFELSFI